MNTLVMAEYEYIAQSWVLIRVHFHEYEYEYEYILYDIIVTQYSNNIFFNILKINIVN